MCVQGYYSEKKRKRRLSLVLVFLLYVLLLLSIHGTCIVVCMLCGKKDMCVRTYASPGMFCCSCFSFLLFSFCWHGWFSLLFFFFFFPACLSLFFICCPINSCHCLFVRQSRRSLLFNLEPSTIHPSFLCLSRISIVTFLSDKKSHLPILYWTYTCISNAE